MDATRARMKTLPLLFVTALGLGVAFMACSSSPEKETASSSSGSSSGDCHMGAGGSGATPAELGACPDATAAGSACCEVKFGVYCFQSEVVGNQEVAEVFGCEIGGWMTQVASNVCAAHTSAEWSALNGQACTSAGQVCVHGGDTDGPMEPLIVAVCGGNGLWTVK